MPTLPELRTKLPELEGLDDAHAVDLIQQVYYPRIDRAVIADRLGIKPTAPPKPERSLMRAGADLALSGARGVGTGVRMMSDLVGADNAVSRGLRSGDEFLRGLQSERAAANEAEVGKIMQEAENKGVLDQVAAAGRAFMVDPASMIVNAAGTSVPTIAAAMLPGGQAALAARFAGAGIGAAQGVGAVKGSIYDTTKQELLQAGASQQEAEARALERQKYANMSASQLGGGAALGALAGSSGAERIVASMRSAAAKQAPAGVLRRTASGAVTEAFPEALQGGHEQYATNEALRAEGFDRAPMAGVIGQSVLEGIAGAGVGGAFGAAVKPGDHVRATKLPEAGPASRAINAGKEAEAQAVDAAAEVAPAEAQPPEAPPQTRRQETAAIAEQLAQLAPEARAEALQMMTVADNPRASPHVRRRAMNRLDVLLHGSAALVQPTNPGMEFSREDAPFDPGLADAPAQDPGIDYTPEIDTTGLELEREQAPLLLQNNPTPTGRILVDPSGVAARETVQDAAARQAEEDRAVSLGMSPKRRGLASVAEASEQPPVEPVAQQEPTVTPAELPQAAVEAPADAAQPSHEVGGMRTFPESLGVPRSEMPQIESAHHGALMQFTQARGVQHETVEVDPRDLKATQNEFNHEKVKALLDAPASGRSVLVSSDGFIIDGHHQALAAAAKGEQLKVIRFDKPIRDMLALAKEFPSSTTSAEQRAAEKNADQPSANPAADGADEQKQASRPVQADAGTATRPVAATGSIADEAGVVAKSPPQRRMSKKAAERHAAREAKRSAYFTPGNIVRGYGGLDEVLAYNPPDENGNWSVRVHRVRKDGDEWVREGKPKDARQHATEPEEKPLADGPVARLSHTAGSAVRYAEPRQDGRPHSGAPDRGVAPAKPQAPAEKKTPAAEQAPARPEAEAPALSPKAEAKERGSDSGVPRETPPPAKTDDGKPVRVLARAGRTPNAAAPIELRANADGTLTPWHEGYALANFESGEPVVLPANVSDADAKKAIRDAGALSAKINFFSAKKPAAEAGDEARFSRRLGEQEHILQALSDTDELFALPRLKGKTVSEIAFDLDPTIKVRRQIAGPGQRERWRVIFPEGGYADISIRAPNPFGPTLYGFDLADGEMVNPVHERPGENPDDVPAATEDVILDASPMKEGQGGDRAYAIAGALAHNTGRIFIGDPAGLSDVALRRRSENMLSLALRYGTSDFLAPHPRQVEGDKALGVPPLKWVYGDDLGNIERLIALNVAAVENAAPESKVLDFDVATGSFRNTESGRSLGRAFLESGTKVRRRGGSPSLAAGAAGGRTTARAVVWRALLREASRAGEGGRGRVELLGDLGADGVAGPAVKGLFSKSANSTATAGGSSAAIEQAVSAITARWANAPTVHVVDSMSDPRIPEAVRAEDQRQRSQGATGEPEGFYADGAVYIVAPQVTSADVQRVLFHEALGHAGLRGVYGKGLGDILDQIARARPADVRKKAEQYGLDFSKPAGRRIAAEEVLAEMAQTRPEIGFVKRAIAAIRSFLRSAGLNLKLSDSDIVAGYILPARAFVERGGKPATAQQRVAVLSRSGAEQTDSAAFRKWFGDSKVVDDEDKPLVVYHGTASGDISQFLPHDGGDAPNTQRSMRLVEAFRKLKAESGRMGYMNFRAGSFFSPDPNYAGNYTGERGGAMYPVYVKAENPVYMDQVTGKVSVFDSSKTPDALVLRDGDTINEVAVLDPTQIKSAIGNHGEFDGANPDIRFSRAGSQQVVGDTGRKYTAAQRQAMRNVGFETDKPTLQERAKELWRDAGKKLAQGIVDQFAPIKDLSQEAYGLMRLSKGASGAFETLLQGGKLKLTDGVYDFDERARGGVVESLLKPLQGEHHDFFRWVAAHRAERLMAEGREHLFSASDIAALKTLADGELDADYTFQNGLRAGRTTRNRAVAYADALNTLASFNRNVLDMAEQSGLIDPEARKVWEHDFYVPFYRVADDGGVAGVNVKSGAVRQEAFKTLKGGKNALNADLLDNTLMNWSHLLDAAAKNRGAKATLDAAVKAGIAIESTEAAVRDMAKSVQQKNGVVWVMDGGQKRYFLVSDPYVLSAISALEYAGMRNPMMNAMGAMKHALTVGVTASPFFKIRNLIRDSVQAIGTSGLSYNPASNVAKGWRLTDPKSDGYFRLLAGGGTIHFGTMLEGSEGKRVQALVESGVSKATILDSEHKVKAFYRKFIQPGVTAYNELGNRGEAVNRASLYDQLVRQGVSHAEASLQARDLMDFSMQGTFTSIRFLTQVVPFFNARIQGMYKLGRSAKENPAKISAVIGAATLASLALLAAYSDDDDWKKREDWDRNNYWWFKFGGTAFRIPKPFEIGAIATLAERGFELMSSDEMTGKRFREQVLTLLSDNLSMNPVPQLVKPMLDVYANKNSFTGRPIESLSMERLAPEYRFTESTSMAARGISSAMNAVSGTIGAESLSPVQVDSLIRGYFGWLGSFVVGVGDLLARPATGQASRPELDLWKMATGGMVSDLRDAPSRYVSQVYVQAKEMEQAYGTWKMLVKEGKVEEATDFRADHKEAIAGYKAVQRIKRTQSEMNQRIRSIEQGAGTSEEKRDMIRQIQDRKDRSARELAPLGG